jgi:hypothetical protein
LPVAWIIAVICTNSSNVFPIVTPSADRRTAQGLDSRRARP